MIEIITYEHKNDPKKPSTLGEFTVRVPKMGIIIRRIKHMRSDKGEWFQFPTFAIEDLGGKRWYSFIEFIEKPHQDAFMLAIRPAIKEFLEKFPPPPVGQEVNMNVNYNQELPF